jgi:hypothetical protein
MRVTTMAIAARARERAGEQACPPDRARHSRQRVIPIDVRVPEHGECKYQKEHRTVAQIESQREREQARTKPEQHRRSSTGS